MLAVTIDIREPYAFDQAVDGWLTHTQAPLLDKLDALITAMTALHESNTALLGAMMESDASDGDARVVASHPHGTMD